MRLTVLRIMTKMTENDNVLYFMVISFSFLTVNYGLIICCLDKWQIQQGVHRVHVDPLQTGTENSLLVFCTVTPFKIDENQNQNHSINKIKNLENEKRDIGKDPRQDPGQRNISYTRYPKKCLPKFIEICMQTPCWCSPG